MNSTWNVSLLSALIWYDWTKYPLLFDLYNIFMPLGVRPLLISYRFNQAGAAQLSYIYNITFDYIFQLGETFHLESREFVEG